LRAFYGAGIAGKRGDFGGFITNLKQANELFEKVMPDVHAALDELPRRERCHQLFLRYLGHGGVSAFALTEPTAGSDSGGVKTTATLHTAHVRTLPDGRYSFVLTEGDAASVRYLIDADGSRSRTRGSRTGRRTTRSRRSTTILMITLPTRVCGITSIRGNGASSMTSARCGNPAMKRFMSSTF
jgi:hypothetical protein